jgi:DNA-binding LacI/PurR family transcriptional regulator
MMVRSVRRRVALLMDAIEDDYQAGIVRGVARAIAHSNVGLVCVAGGVLGDPKVDHRAHRNFLFDLLDPREYDGLIVLSGSLGNTMGAPRFAEWLQRFRGKPVVALGVETPGFPSIAVDGAAGMRAIVAHLIQAHNRRRIAFVRGPQASEEAEERFAAYRKVLEENGIPFEERLVAQGTWLRESGALAMREILDIRGVGNKGIDAVVSANDYMAFGVIDELRHRGLEVPSDVAVTGFDDVDGARSMAPPLTTVRQPVEALGREGLRRLVAIMNGSDREPVSAHMLAEVTQRRSCGCTKARPSEPPRPSNPHRRSFEAMFMERRTVIAAEMARAAQGAFFGAGNAWEERLYTALLRDILGGESHAFAMAIDQVLGKVQRAGGDIGVSTSILAALRRGVLACAPEDLWVLASAEDILDNARDLIGEWLVRAERLRATSILHQLRELSRMASDLVSASDASAVRRSFEARLRGLQVAAASIGLFKRPGSVGDECVSLVGYARQKSLAGEAHFPSRSFGHPQLRDCEDPLLVQPLFLGSEPLGIASLAWGALDEAVYEQAREILAVGVKAFVSAATDAT